jgi:hypothetical protein
MLEHVADSFMLDKAQQGALRSASRVELSERKVTMLANDIVRPEQEDAPEEWRPVVGFGENYYEVSSAGRVRRIETRHVLKPRPKKNGYLQVNPSICGRARNRHVHEMVALSFIGPRPPGLEINHKNHQKSDNSVGNLEYVTHSQNAHEAAIRGLMGSGRTLRGSENPNSRLSEDDVRLIRRLFDSGEATRRDLADRFGVTWENVNRIVRRQTWKEVS